MAEKDEKLPRLAIVEGIEEPFPNGETIEGPMNKISLGRGIQTMNVRSTSMHKRHKT
jgi:hypothetical protein